MQASAACSAGESDSGKDRELGDYTWLCRVTNMLRPTAQSMVSRGQIPGVVRLGKRLTRFDKRIVRAWIASRTRSISETE